MDNFRKIFEYLEKKEPAEHLLGKIVSEIRLEREKREKRKFFTGTAFFTVSIFAFIPAIKYFISEIARSGFSEYISLLFSDTGAIAIYWKEFGLVLLESMPIFAIACVLAVIFTLLVSLYEILSIKKSFALNK